ncbi:PIN domain-containing protein [Cellulomonas shaoxiangyii]|uniref:Ribonuclease VapC n=1 Tax=Cellulomonas shaoxiangyii TaxID=2566013 RepID=A0A4P7SLX4_9CELL|nr:PIN domain-containing protein [Cellulomonas shaoxiangyii]QCB94758.1 PIN domain-containing protein [Cellulomonas shaoxiangyii]TGY86488.1 PIN domain-containing protein [Cellulomonas shaoxiangyii]
MPEVIYLDSSVAIHVLVGTRSAVRWWDERVSAGDRLISSVLLNLEVARFLHRERLDPRAGDFLTESLHPVAVDNALLVEAAHVPAVLKTLDCVHLASAARVGTRVVTVATHDRSMAGAATQMGFATIDPVTA